MDSMYYVCLWGQIAHNRYNRQLYLDNYRRRNQKDRLFYMSGYIRVWWSLENQSFHLVQTYFWALCICHVQTKYQSYCHQPILLCLRAFLAVYSSTWCAEQPVSECVAMPRFAEIKKIGIQYNDMQKENNKITKSSVYIIKIYNLQEDGCSTFSKVSVALSFSTHCSSLNCSSIFKTKNFIYEMDCSRK